MKYEAKISYNTALLVVGNIASAGDVLGNFYAFVFVCGFGDFLDKKKVFKKTFAVRINTVWM